MVNSRPSASRRTEASPAGAGWSAALDCGSGSESMNANVPPGLSQPPDEPQERVEAGAGDVAQPEAGEHGVHRAVGLGPRVTDVEVGAESMRDQTFACAIERRRRRVVERELALRGEQWRPPAGPGGELDDVAVDRQVVEPATRDVELGVPGGIVDGPARIAAAAQVPVVVFGCPRLVVGEHLGVDVSRGGRRRRGRHDGRGRRRGCGRRDGHSRGDRRCGSASARGAPLGQRLVQPEAEEPVVARLADAIGAELRPAFEIVGTAADVGGPAPQAVEGRAKRHDRTYGPTGVQEPSGAMSTNAPGSKISASSSIPSITLGPGRLKYADPSSAKTCPRRTAVKSS